MKPNFIRQFFRPLFEAGRSELIARFLYVIITSVIVAIVFEVGFYLWDGGSLVGISTSALLGLLFLQLLFLLLLHRGYAKLVVWLLVTTGWIGITYQAWIADGVRDVIVYAYALIIFMGAMLTSWRTSLLLIAASIAAIWVMALAESRGLKAPGVDSPIHIARDLTAIFVLLVVLVFLLVDTLRQSLEKTKDDMAARIHAQQALIQSEERFYKIFQLSPVAIVITAFDDGKLLEANPAYWSLSGQDPVSSKGRTALELRPNLMPETRKQFLGELSDKQSIHNPAYDFVNDHGEHLKTIAFYELIEVDGEQAILSMFYDVTEQNKARDALRNSETRLRAMLEAVPDMIFELTRDGVIVHFIPSTIDGLNMSPEAFIGKNIADVLPQVADQTRFVIERALSSGQVNAFEYQLLINGEERTFEARVTPMGDDLVLAIVRDVTLQRWALLERESLIDELESKNAELERFTYTVSHDLKSPLITIKGFLGYVREDAMAANKERLERDIERINDATDKMVQLLADLLELSRVGRLVNKMGTFQSYALVSEIVDLLHGLLDAGNIRVEIAGDLPLIHGDRPRIGEVFQNLIENAAKFMGDQPDPRIEISVNGELNGKPVFFVRDNGVGIAPQYKDKVFGLFDKLNAQTEGTGIGLALVKRIVEHHGGSIWIESELGAGATFLFTLPSPPPSED